MLFKPLALLALLPLVSSVIITSVEGPDGGPVQSQSPVTINWEPESTDPETITIELTHPSFNQAIAIANNVFTSDGTATVTLPVVPADSGYTIIIVQIDNINDVLGTSGGFAIAPVSSSSASSTTSGTSSGSGTSSTRPPTSTPTSAGTTSSNGSSTRTSTSTSAGSTPSNFNNTGGASRFGISVVGAGLAAVAATFLVL